MLAVSSCWTVGLYVVAIKLLKIRLKPIFLNIAIFIMSYMLNIIVFYLFSFPRECLHVYIQLKKLTLRFKATLCMLSGKVCSSKCQLLCSGYSIFLRTMVVWLHKSYVLLYNFFSLLIFIITSGPRLGYHNLRGAFWYILSRKIELRIAQVISGH